MTWVFAFIASWPVWVFDPTGLLSFRAFHWGALFIVALILFALSLRGAKQSAIPTLALLGFLPPLAGLFIAPADGSLLLMAGWASFLILSTTHDRHPRLHTALVHGILFGAGLNMGLLLLQRLGADPLFSIRSAVSGAAHAGYGAAGFTGFMGNPADLAILLVLCLPLVEIATRKPWQKYLGWAVAAFALALTASRLPMLVGATYITWKVPGRWRLAVPALLVLLVLAYPPLRYKTVSAVERGLLTEQLDRRFSEWSIAAGVFADHPLFGVGPGNYGAAAAEERYDRGLPVGQRHGWFKQAHNDLLQVAAETGVFGLVCFTLALLPFAVSIVRRKTAMDGWVLAPPLLFFHFPLQLAGPVMALATLSQLPSGDRYRLGAKKQALLIPAMLAGLFVTVGGFAVGHGIVPADSGEPFLWEARRKFELIQLQQAVSKGDSAKANAHFESIARHEPHPRAAALYAQQQLHNNDLQAAIEALCRSYVATGDAVLRARLEDLQDHVKNLATRNPEFRACLF